MIFSGKGKHQNLRKRCFSKGSEISFARSDVRKTECKAQLPPNCRKTKAWSVVRLKALVCLSKGKPAFDSTRVKNRYKNYRSFVKHAFLLRCYVPPQSSSFLVNCSSKSHSNIALMKSLNCLKWFPVSLEQTLHIFFKAYLISKEFWKKHRILWTFYMDTKGFYLFFSFQNRGWT